MLAKNGWEIFYYMEPDPEPNLKPLFDAVSDLPVAAQLLQRGKVVVYPTDTFYGLFAAVFSKDALQTIWDLKEREGGAPLPCIIGKADHLSRLAASVNSSHRLLMEKYWPGPLTLVFDSRPDVPKIVTGNTGSVGIRIPSRLSTRRLAEIVGPLVATSANMRGAPPINDPEALTDIFPGIPVFSAGIIKPSKGSTVLDPRLKMIKLIRNGDIPASVLEETLQTTFERVL